MVTSSAITNTAVNVQLPTASTSTGSAVERSVVVSLLANGSILINNKALKNSFEEELKNAFAQTSSRIVVLEGDKDASLGLTIEIMDKARAVGAVDFAIATSQKGIQK